MAARGSSSAEIIVMLVLHAQGLSTWRYKGNGDVTWFVPEVGQRLWAMVSQSRASSSAPWSSVVSQCVRLSSREETRHAAPSSLITFPRLFLSHSSTCCGFSGGQLQSPPKLPQRSQTTSSVSLKSCNDILGNRFVTLKKMSFIHKYTTTYSLLYLRCTN